MNDEIAIRIKKARQQNGINKAQFAKMLNVDPKTISNYENAVTSIPGEIILKYAELCGVSPTYLLTGKEDEKEDKEYREEQITFYKEQVEFYKLKVKELEEKLNTKK